MFILHASSLASAIGRNPFQSPSECFEYHNKKESKYGNKPEIYDKKLKDGQKLETLVETIKKEINEKVVRDDNKFIEEIQNTLREKCPKEIVREAITIPQKIMGVEREKIIVNKLDIIQSDKPIGKNINTKYGRIFLVGRLDGKKKKDGKIVEIKNRTRRLFNRIYPSEMCQLYAYMFLTNNKQIIHIECYNGEIRETLVEWNDKYWQGILEDLEIYTKNFSESLGLKKN